MRRGIQSIILNLVFPGLGHYYIGQRLKAGIFAVIVLFTFGIGLSLDLQHYYWYTPVMEQEILVSREDGASPAVKGILERVNPYFDDTIRLFAHPTKTSSKTLDLAGHTKPGLTLEAINELTGDKVQTQSDYKGFFHLNGFPLFPGENKILVRTANEFMSKHANRVISVPHTYTPESRYKPGTLEKLWHFIYSAIFPVLKTPILHITGGFFQGMVIHWWDIMPIVKNQKSIPAPLRDVGFYYVILVCMFNLLILFDGYDSCYNESNREGKF